MVRPEYPRCLLRQRELRAFARADNRGRLHGVDCDTGLNTELCRVALPNIEGADDDTYFGAPILRLHPSSDGRFAAIVIDKGKHGIVVNIHSSEVTMHFNGGDYYEETVPFGACFLWFEGRSIFVHRTEWNRLDAADPATGESLTILDLK